MGSLDIVGTNPPGSVPTVSPIASSTPIVVNLVPALDEGFVSVISSAGTSIVFSSYLPGQSPASGIAVDSSENIYIGGAGSLTPIMNAYNGILNDQLILEGCGGPGLAIPTAVQFAEQIPVGSNSEGCSENVLLTNVSSSGTVNITNIAITGDFTQTNDCPSALNAATSCVVQVTFAPSAGGLRTGALTIADGQPGSPQVVQLSGTALAPQVSLTPGELTFPSQGVATTSSSQVVNLANMGGATLTISGVSISGDFAETNNCGLSVGASSSCQIAVTFTPTATGTRNGTLSVADSASGSPQTVPLTGTGGAAGFAIGPASGQQSSQTISPGQSAQFNLSLTSTSGFSGTVNLTRTLAPVVTPVPTCSLSNSSVQLTAGGAQPLTVSVGTTAPTTSAMIPYSGWPSGWLQWEGAVTLFGLGVLFLRKLRRSPLSGIAIVALVMASGGCAGGKATSHTTPGTPTGLTQRPLLHSPAA